MNGDKREKLTFILAICGWVVVAITSLVLIIVILTRITKDASSNESPSNHTDTETASNHTSTRYPPYVGPVNNSPAWKQAATIILEAINQSVDPCEDFYAFTCDNYIARANEQEMPYKSSYFDVQKEVCLDVAQSLEKIDVNDGVKWSETERITKVAFDACLMDRKPGNRLPKKLQDELIEWFGGIPFLNQDLKEHLDLFAILGSIEQTYGTSIFMESKVFVDPMNVSQHVLLITQPKTLLPKVFYERNYLLGKANKSAHLVGELMSRIAANLSTAVPPSLIEESARAVQTLDMHIALASSPVETLRNFAQSYSSFTLADLQTLYSSISWQPYLANLLSSSGNATEIASNKFLLAPLSYFAWLNWFLEGFSTWKNELVNYIITKLLFTLSGQRQMPIDIYAMQRSYLPNVAEQMQRMSRDHKSQLKSSKEGVVECCLMLIRNMPFGAGYVYMKSKQNRREVVEDAKRQARLIMDSFLATIDNLEWMTNLTKAAAKKKCANVQLNFGWPFDLFGDFKNSTIIDTYHRPDYYPIVAAYNKNKDDHHAILEILRKGKKNRHGFRLLTEKAERSAFDYSPAIVNAFYSPVKNAITAPYAILNAPKYKIDYPPAFNYAGQGSTSGHELIHGFNGVGSQFAHNGSLANCTWYQCGWMDDQSIRNLSAITQCIVNFYRSNCCPKIAGVEHCCDGVFTYEENLADIGGVRLAYNAYQQYKNQLGKEEPRLPGLEQFTSNQIFWIAYGRKHCERINADYLNSKLLMDRHAPAQCRVNQVVQNIPGFGKDFGCRQGDPMYPKLSQRCDVWV